MAAPSHDRIRNSIALYLGVLLATYALLLGMHSREFVDFAQHIWIFAPVGVFGAIIANATGTGGGVVFVPAFNTLSGASEMGTIPMEIQIDAVSTIGISFLIQCFGMSVGSCVWLNRFYVGNNVAETEKINGNEFLAICFTVLVTALPALLITQFVLFDGIDKDILLLLFKLFSLALGVFLLVFTWSHKRARPSRFRMDRSDRHNLLIIGAAGGIITALFSVGVGELVAVYLIWRKFP
ncbi:MAG: hypothetical protein ACR2PI_11035, partial [Hyphomicrobiaceae bacterium]